MGIDLARRAMGRFLAGDDEDRDFDSSVHPLSKSEQRAIRRELAELILLEVRAGSASPSRR